MAFLRPRKVEKNYDLISACAWYTPGVAGLFSVLGWFVVGMILAAIVVMPMTMSGALDTSWSMLIMYPIQFLPVFIFVRLQSSRNSTFERGYKLDSNHFAPAGGAVVAVLAVLATIGASLMLEAVNAVMPDMSDALKKTMEALTGGPLWISLLCTAVLAPVCEEWLCRGVILRGLLNYKRKPTDIDYPGGRGMSPALAIMISAIFFAVIHGNIWQGIAAFTIGCLLGYVYYRTGSLKLTMLMHCANNSFSVLCGHFGGEKVSEAKSMLDLMPFWEYAIIFVVSAVIVFAFIRQIAKVETADTQGNCDIIPSADDECRSLKTETATTPDSYDK